LLSLLLLKKKKDRIEIDFSDLKNLTKEICKEKVDYLVLLGSTAETPTLKREEKDQIISLVRKTIPPGFPLVIGVGGNCTSFLLEEIKNTAISQEDAILIASPYYNKPTQEGIYAHYKQIADHVPNPIILYNVPSRTGSNLLPKTVIKLALDFENIIGIKEAAGDFIQILELIRLKKEKKLTNFRIISGMIFWLCLPF